MNKRKKSQQSWSQSRPIPLDRIAPDDPIVPPNLQDFKRVVECWPDRMRAVVLKPARPADVTVLPADPDDFTVLARAATIIAESGAQDWKAASKPIIQAWKHVDRCNHRLGDIRAVRLFATGGMVPELDELRQLQDRDDDARAAIDAVERAHRPAIKAVKTAGSGCVSPELARIGAAYVRDVEACIYALRAKSERERRDLDAALSVDHPLSDPTGMWRDRRRAAVRMLLSDLARLNVTPLAATARAILEAYFPDLFESGEAAKHYVERMLNPRRA